MYQQLDDIKQSTAGHHPWSWNVSVWRHLVVSCYCMSPVEEPTAYQPTHDGDVAQEGAVGVAEALIGFEAPGAEPGQGGGAELWTPGGNGGRQRLRGGQGCCRAGRGGGHGGAGGDGWCYSIRQRHQRQHEDKCAALENTLRCMNVMCLQCSPCVVSILTVTAWVGISGGGTQSWHNWISETPSLHPYRW